VVVKHGSVYILTIRFGTLSPQPLPVASASSILDDANLTAGAPSNLIECIHPKEFSLTHQSNVLDVSLFPSVLPRLPLVVSIER
jgi:hypothetical protein